MPTVPNADSQTELGSKTDSLSPPWIPFSLGAVSSLLSFQHQVRGFPARGLCWCGFSLCYKALKFYLWFPITGKDFLVDSLQMNDRLHL